MVEKRIARGEGAVLYAKDGALAIVSLNRPDRLNAYNVAMRDGLYEALQAIRDDPEVRVVILHGNGPSFCTGGDLSEFGTAPSALAARDARWRRDVWSLLRGLPQLTLAAVHGYVVGGGFEMALLCDLCIAANSARFSFPETGLGMIPGVAGTQTAPRLLGNGRALDLVLSGRELSARDALRLGIVTRVVPPGKLLSSAVELARRTCQLPATRVTQLKRLVYEGLDLPLVEGLRLERRLAGAGL